jgi:ribonuclease P protein subunit POP4
VFRVEVPEEEKLADKGVEVQARDHDSSPSVEPSISPKKFIFDIHGDQFLYRAADRSSRKWKTHFSKKL